MTAVVLLEGMTFHAFHGVHPEERLIGTQFVVDIELTMKMPADGFRDELKNTIDYEEVYDLIASVMKESKYLIETLAEDILSEVFEKQPLAAKATVSVSKMHPPVGGACHKSKIILTKERSY
jgi:dihydroneopterin aldolase